MDARLDKLLSVVEQQHAIIVQQSEQIALLTQSVALLLGEDLGTPVPEGGADESQRVDLDGVPY